jgi:hypothetical protein
MRIRAVLLAAALCAGSLATRPAPAPAAAKGCDGVQTLALTHLSDAVTTGDDRVVLTTSLKESARLRACGHLDDAISLELIAADAYGDTSEAAKRCDLLTKIYDELKTRDAARAGRVHAALASCGVAK